jgi:hypothetical protein
VRLFSGSEPWVLDWLSKRVEFILPSNTHLIWGLGDDGGLLGGMGFGGRMGKTWGSISIALVEHRAAIPLIRASACWLFGAQEARAGYATISSRRSEWIDSLVRTVGFREVDRVRAGINHKEDLVILKLTPETCRPWQAELRKLRALHAREAG